MKTIETGDIKTLSQNLRKWKVISIKLVENELIIGFKRKGVNRGFNLYLKGLIKFQDSGIHGKSLLNYTINDKGSFKEINLYRANADLLLQCDYMEGEIRIS